MFEHLIKQEFEDILSRQIECLGYIVEKSSYEIVYLNRYLLSQYSASNKSLLDYKSKKCYNLLYNLDQPCKHCKIDKVEVGKFHKTNYFNEKYGIWFSLKETLIIKDGKEYLCKNSFDITSELKEVGELKDIIVQDKIIIACAETLFNKSSFDSSINKLLKLMCDFFGGDFACLFERDYKNSISKVTYKYHVEDTNLIDNQYTKPFKIEPDDSWTKFLLKKKFAYLQSSDDIDETLKNSNYYNRFMNSNRNNLLVVSLNDEGKILGAIEIDNISHHTQYIQLVYTVSSFIVTILHIKNQTESLETNINSLETKDALNNTILECVKTLVYDDNLDLSLNKLLEIICDYFDGNVTNILYKDTNSDMLVCDYGYTKDPNVTDPRIRNFPALNLVKLYKAYENEGVAYISSIREQAGNLQENFPVEYEAFVRKGIKSLLCAPLYQDGEIVGFIGVQNPTKNLKELHLVKTMCTFVVNHIRKNELLVKLEKLSYIDSLTSTYNRNFYNNYVEEFNINPRNNVGVIFADVNGLKKANDNFGHELGDDLIKGSSNFLRKYFNGLIFRIGGDEFVCIIENISKDKFLKVVENINTKLNSFNELHISIGEIWKDKVEDIESLISEADEDMYTKKKQHYKKSSNDERSVKQYLIDLKKSIQELKDV